MSPAEGPVLRDIPLPPAPAWGPPAPGWWLLAAIGLLGCVVLGLRLRQRARERRLRAAILRELDRCIEAARGDRAVLAASLSQFLRRFALRETPAAAAYAGERWLEYLDLRANSSEFRGGVGRVLIEAPFRPNIDYDTVALVALVRRWLRTTLDSEQAHA